MKLIELLARELKEWPDDAEVIAQDTDGDVWSWSGEPHWSNTQWCLGDNAKLVEMIGNYADLASDHATTVVRRAQWETAMYSPTVTAPTLETMLTEWRDLNARAQAAQAEADALFEHAGQCHGEIVVRLAELGWGAPRMVPGEPVVTLDDDDGWIEWKGGKCPVVKGTLIDQKLRDGRVYRGSRVGDFGNCTRGMFWRHDGDNSEVVAYRLTPSTQP